MTSTTLPFTFTSTMRPSFDDSYPPPILDDGEAVSSDAFDDALERIPSFSDADLVSAFHRFVDMETEACVLCEQQSQACACPEGFNPTGSQIARHRAFRLREACAAELMQRRLHV